MFLPFYTYKSDLFCKGKTSCNGNTDTDLTNIISEKDSDNISTNELTVFEPTNAVNQWDTGILLHLCKEKSRFHVP